MGDTCPECHPWAGAPYLGFAGGAQGWVGAVVEEVGKMGEGGFCRWVTFCKLSYNM